MPVQVGCMRQVLRAGALGRPRGMGWGGRWEGGSGWGTHVNPWLLHVNVWQKPLQYCKVISFQLIKKRKKKGLQNQPKISPQPLYPWNSQQSTLAIMVLLCTCRSMIKRLEKEPRSFTPAGELFSVVRSDGMLKHTKQKINLK